MGRFGRFNPRQKRDRKGRWSKGGGGASKPSAKKAVSTKGRPDANKFARRGAKIGAGIGAVSILHPLLSTPKLVAVGTIAGTAVGASFDRRAARKRKKG